MVSGESDSILRNKEGQLRIPESFRDWKAAVP
jgi:hypothetical protein